MKCWLIVLWLLVAPAIALANWLYLPGPGYSRAVSGTSIPAACNSTTFCWLAESTAVEVPETTATLSSGAEIVSGGYSGNMVETNNDSSGFAAISIGSADFNEQSGSVDLWIKNNSVAGSTSQRYIFEALGQTGTFAISVTHYRVTVLYGSSTTTLDTTSNYLIGTLRHIVITWDDATDTITINVDSGVYSTSNTAATGTISGDATTINIAGRSGTTGYISADEIKVY